MAAAQVAYSVAPSAGHDLAGHYECAKRIPAILEALQQNELTSDAQPHKVRKHNLRTPAQVYKSEQTESLGADALHGLR